MGSWTGAVSGGIGATNSALADKEEAENLIDDANYYTELATQARIAGIDKARIRQQRLDRETGEHVARTAKSGVELKGTPMTTLIEVLKRGEQDLGAIKEGADIAFRSALGKSRAARHHARYIRTTYRLRMSGAFWSGGGGSSLSKAGQSEQPAGDQEIPESEKLGPGDRSEGEAPKGYDD